MKRRGVLAVLLSPLTVSACNFPVNAAFLKLDAVELDRSAPSEPLLIITLADNGSVRPSRLDLSDVVVEARLGDMKPVSRSYDRVATNPDLSGGALIVEIRVPGSFSKSILSSYRIRVTARRHLFIPFGRNIDSYALYEWAGTMRQLSTNPDILADRATNEQSLSGLRLDAFRQLPY